ncbi:unnamed protein product [Orchesella dallaii]|uniref:Ionotropic glutamate receptor C-terminal domain-containing protein n=1 Tax=Orchesella dallaii TaxID=48710 RepID=A0ABP1RHL5_9HEXA
MSVDFILLEQHFKNLESNPSYTLVHPLCDICHNDTVYYEDMVFKEMAFKWILESNSKISIRQRFTSKDILLASDSIFPSKRFGHGLLQTEINSNFRRIPTKIPTVVLLETSLTPENILEVEKSTRIIISETTSALLIFVDSYLKFVSIGCFTCEQFVAHYAILKSAPMYPVSFQSLPIAIGTFENLEKHWRNLHSKLQFRNNENNIDQMCYLTSSREMDETCETYKSFFEEKNCSSFTFCMNYFYDDLMLQSTQSKRLRIKFLSQIFPFGLRETHFKLQVLLPKVHVLESGLGAYLTPFDIKIWICTIITSIGIFLLVWRKEEDNFTQVVFWQFATLIEQDGPKHALKSIRVTGTTMVLMWMVVAILLRLFYTASLYSFMTAEMKPNDFPQTLEEVVDKDDFELLLTFSFFTELNSWFWGHSSNHLPQVRSFYFRIISKAFIAIDRQLEIQILQNLSNGISAKMMHYPLVNRNAISDREFRMTTPIVSVEKRFSKFATLCEEDCNSNSNEGLVGQKSFYRIIPDQTSPLLQSFEFWALRFTNFATLSFSKFFGSFVHSGLYEFSIKHYRLRKRVNNMQQLNVLGTLGMSNASLYSFVFLANQKEIFVEEEEATNISVLKGTLLIGTFMFCSAFTIFLWELRKYLKNSYTN